MDRRLLVGAALVAGLTLALAGCSSVQGQVIKKYEADLRGKGGLAAPVGAEVAGDRMTFTERKAEGDAVLLLHGVGGEKANWYRFAEFLPSRFRVVVPDLPPFGESGAPKSGDYSAAGQVARLEALREQLGIERWHVVGNSMGGLVAVHYAHMHPDRVITLGLFAAAGAVSADQSDAEKLREEGTEVLMVHDEASFDRLFSMLTYHPVEIPAVVKGYFVEQAIAQAELAKPVGEAIGPDYAAVEKMLPEIQTPSLVLWGKDDRILHSSGADVFDGLLPHSEKVVLLECGHVPMLEHPKTVAESWVSFVDKASGAEVSAEPPSVAAPETDAVAPAS